jgi:hypothetical protein
MPAQGKEPWFPVKRFGYGVGFPIAWEGWLVLALYAAAMIFSGSLLPTLAFVIAAIPLTAAVIYISYVSSNGEWRYRNGE